MKLPEILFDERLSEKHKGAVLEYIASFPDGGAPAILSLEHFCVITGLTTEAVFGITNSTHSFYRTFSVRKANGGERKINAPLPAALLAQKWILSNILEKRSCHPAAKAYVKGQSIKSNAKFHRAQKYVLKVDVSNFFGSIKEFYVYKIFRSFGYTKPVSTGLTKICCLDGSLPQGAATSGYLSNLLLLSFDEEMLKFCQERKLRYTRYADDIAISGEEIDWREVIKKIQSIFDTLSLRINLAKTKLIPQSNRQKIAGVVVNDRLSVQKDYRREIRKAHYFIMKHGIFGHARFIKNNNPKVLLEKVIGQVSHAQFINKNDAMLASIKEDLIHERRSVFGY